MNRETTLLCFTSLAFCYQVGISAGSVLSYLLPNPPGASAIQEYDEGMERNNALAEEQKKILYTKVTDAAKAQKKMIKDRIAEAGTTQDKLLGSHATCLATTQGDALTGRAQKKAKVVSRKILASAEIAKKRAQDDGYNGAFDGVEKVLNDAIKALKVKTIAAAPYLVVGGITIGAYLLYRYNYPPPSTAQQLIMTENAYKNSVTARETALQTSRVSFNQCLRYHANGELNAEAYPAACEDAARTYAFLAGPKQVQEGIETFRGETNLPSNVPLYGMILLGIVSSK